MGKQKYARFPSATKASATEFLNRLLPQVEANLNVGSAGPKASAPMKERFKCPCNHRCSASRAGFEVAMQGLLKSPKRVADDDFSNRSAHSGPHDQKVRRALAHLPSLREIRGPLVPPWASKLTQAHLRLSDSTVLPLEPILGTQLGQNRNTYSEGALSLGPAVRAIITTGQAMSPTICHLPRSTPSWNRALATCWRRTRSSGDIEHPHPSPQIVPWEEGRGRRSNRHPHKGRCDLLGQARCPSRRL